MVPEFYDPMVPEQGEYVEPLRLVECLFRYYGQHRAPVKRPGPSQFVVLFNCRSPFASTASSANAPAGLLGGGQPSPAQMCGPLSNQTLESELANPPAWLYCPTRSLLVSLPHPVH